MGYAEKHTLNLTTDSAGDVTAYTPRVSGRISQIVYTKIDFDAGVDFTITVDDTAEGVWTESNVNASKTVAPRQPTHDLVGVASLYAAAGEGVEDKIALANDRVKVVIAAGGNVKSGTIDVLII